MDYFITLYDIPIDATTSALNAAAKCGQLGVIRWLVSRGLMLTIESLTIAASNGHLHVVKYMCEIEAGSPKVGPALLIAVARTLKLPELQYLVEHSKISPDKWIKHAIYETVNVDAYDNEKLEDENKTISYLLTLAADKIDLNHPLLVAADKNHHTVKKLLITHGATYCDA